MKDTRDTTSGNAKKTMIERIRRASATLALLAALGFTGLVAVAGHKGNEASQAQAPQPATALAIPQAGASVGPQGPGLSAPSTRPPRAVAPRSSQEPRVRSRAS